jgi:hypothetical protein
MNTRVAFATLCAGAVAATAVAADMTAAALPAAAPTTNWVANGTFDAADPERPAKPLAWDLPDGLGIQWTNAPAGADGIDRGKAIRMDTRVSERDMVASWRRAGLDQWDIPNAAPDPVAATYGLSYYSIPIPATTNHRYRIAFDVYAPGGGAKVWVRGYAPTRDGTLRRSYETVVHCRPKPNEWCHEERVFSPAKSRADIRELRVMLYAYWPAGVYWFDNVRLEAVAPEE